MRRTLAALALACFAAATAPAQTPPPRPEGLTAFAFPGFESDAALLNGFLWYHFALRGGDGPTLFNKEYLAIADLWLAGAHQPATGRTAQQVMRDNLLAIQFDDEGYVQTHQHFSHAHDHGWPFPLWTQIDSRLGAMAGWHFQPLDQVPGWVGDNLRASKAASWCGEAAVAAWRLEQATSHGIAGNRWRIEATGTRPAIVSPEGVAIDAFQAPFLQVRWNATPAPGPDALPCLEWQREGDAGFSAERRAWLFPDKTPLSPPDLHHSIVTLHRHPQWSGKIVRLRLVLAPGPSSAVFDIDSIFTCYDTRHTINNPIYILAGYHYFGWTGDLDFLRRTLNPMRVALRHQQTVLGGLEHKRIRVPWPGHDGRPGFVRNADGTKTIRGGHGIGNNYWDIMPFGGEDLYATNQYYAATLALAALEEAARANPGWQLPLGALALDPAQLRAHAAEVKATVNEHFWNEATGRFVSAIDFDGVRYDYGHTFVNLDAIWYGTANDDRARSLLDWIGGTRIVGGDTAQGPDIYHWRFGPRATTLRNIDWYGQGWYNPEHIPWGGQVQDGGAVLGFSLFDLMARLRHNGPDDAWARLREILAWEAETKAAGGYRAYYAGGKQGTTLQGGGTAGGIGIDAEFYESSLLPAIVPLGFLGLDAQPAALRIAPRLPAACPEMRIAPLLYHGVRMRVTAANDRIALEVLDAPRDPIVIALPEGWPAPPPIDAAGSYNFQPK